MLLRQTVKGPQAPDEVDGVDADDFAAGKAVGNDVERVTVVGVIEGRHQHESVGDVEVRVAGRETLTLEDDRRGHGQFANIERLLFEIAGGAQAIEILRERYVVLVSGVRLDAGEDGVGRDEAGDVVDVTVRVVTGAAAV